MFQHLEYPMYVRVFAVRTQSSEKHHFASFIFRQRRHCQCITNHLSLSLSLSLSSFPQKTVKAILQSRVGNNTKMNAAASKIAAEFLGYFVNGASFLIVLYSSLNRSAYTPGYSRAGTIFVLVDITYLTRTNILFLLIQSLFTGQRRKQGYVKRPGSMILVIPGGKQMHPLPWAWSIYKKFYRNYFAIFESLSQFFSEHPRGKLGCCVQGRVKEGPIIRMLI